MPAQELDRARANEILGIPPDFRDGPDDNPIARGLPAGSITDDTMQCVLVAQLLVDGAGVIAPRALADALMRWEREMARRGRSELLGPSTRRALAALKLGRDPSATGTAGTTNGAAMRIAPVGIATPLERLLDAVVGACTGRSALPVNAVRKVKDVNSLDFEPLVERLLALRSR